MHCIICISDLISDRSLHIPAGHVTMHCIICISDVISDRSLYIHTSRTRYNARHNLTLITIIVARFVGRESFLIRYFNGHMQ
jgi:hypothetical protein